MTAPLIIPAAALARTPDCCGTIVPGAPAPDATIVANDWFPDIDLAHFRSSARVREAVTVDRQRDAILGAIITVGNDLAAWQAARISAGAPSLAAVVDVANPLLGGERRLVILYRRAVYAQAKADLVERQRDVDTTGAGQRRVEELDSSVDELRRDAAWAVRDILAVGRTCVELI